MGNRHNHTLRYLAIAVVFCAVCFIYLGRLFYIQIAGKENTYEADSVQKTVTVQAVRGEIYDRNGVKLVENKYTYNMGISHESFFSLNVVEKNRVCLQIMETLQACEADEQYVQRFFPFEGSSYPDYHYSKDASNTESVRGVRLRRVLSKLGLEKTATEKELTEYYIETYRLLEIGNNGERRYSDDQIDDLIRMYYDMDARDFSKTGEYILIENITFAEAEGTLLMTSVKEKNIPTVTFVGVVERVYLYPGYASHILGKVGPIYSEEWEYYNEQGYQMSAIVGKMGCEYAFESYLRGTDGKIRIEEDGNGNLLSMEVLKKPIAGSDVYLTIDINLQIAAEDGLKENVQYVLDKSSGDGTTGGHCNAGAAVAMNPASFEVLAVASYPTFDLTTYNSDYASLNQQAAKPLLNRAINGAYAPGSTLKLGMAAIGLESGTILANDNFYCKGGYPNKDGLGCSTYADTHAWGSIGIVDAIAHSCNSYFCEIGHRLGILKMEEYLSRFGLGEDTGFELGGIDGVLAGPTYRGEIQSEHTWMPGDTWNAAIGQSDHQMSPLQIAAYTSTLVNGGTRYQAHLLHSVYQFGNAEPTYIFRQTEDTVLSRVSLSNSTLQTVFAGMKKMVAESSKVSSWMDPLPVTVGGKTGTAQAGTYEENGVKKEYYNALFTCTAPYDNPEIVISVVLEKGVSGTDAALTAARILEAYYAE